MYVHIYVCMFSGLCVCIHACMPGCAYVCVYGQSPDHGDETSTKRYVCMCVCKFPVFYVLRATFSKRFWGLASEGALAVQLLVVLGPTQVLSLVLPARP